MKRQAKKNKLDLYYVWRSPRAADNHSIWRLENGDLIEAGFYRKRVYTGRFLDYQLLGRGVFIRIL